MTSPKYNIKTRKGYRKLGIGLKQEILKIDRVWCQIRPPSNSVDFILDDDLDDELSISFLNKFKKMLKSNLNEGLIILESSNIELSLDFLFYFKDYIDKESFNVIFADRNKKDSEINEEIKILHPYLDMNAVMHSKINKRSLTPEFIDSYKKRINWTKYPELIKVFKNNKIEKNENFGEVVCNYFRNLEGDL